LRIIQAGIGGHGATWKHLLQRESEDGDRVQLVAVADPSEWARAVAKEDGIPETHIFTDLAEALRFTEVDAVVIVTPPSTHRALATLAITAGKHVLIEKPLATSIEDATALADLADQQGITLMVSQNYRYQTGIRALQAALRGGTYGTPVSADITFMRDSRTYWPEDNFRYAMDHPLLLDMTIHHFDMLRAVLDRNATSITLESWRIPDSPYRGDVALDAQIVLADDIAVRYLGNWASTGPETTWNGDWQIVTDRGRLHWVGWLDDDREGAILWEPDGGTAEILRPEPLAITGIPASLHAFVEAVRTGTPPETSARDNIESLKLVFGGVTSTETGASVTLS